MTRSLLHWPAQGLAMIRRAPLDALLFTVVLFGATQLLRPSVIACFVLSFTAYVWAIAAFAAADLRRNPLTRACVPRLWRRALALTGRVALFVAVGFAIGSAGSPDGALRAWAWRSEGPDALGGGYALLIPFFTILLLVVSWLGPFISALSPARHIVDGTARLMSDPRWRDDESQRRALLAVVAWQLPGCVLGAAYPPAIALGVLWAGALGYAAYRELGSPRIAR